MLSAAALQPTAVCVQSIGEDHREQEERYEEALPAHTHAPLAMPAWSPAAARAAARSTESGLVGESNLEEIRIRGTFVFSHVFSYFSNFFTQMHVTELEIGVNDAFVCEQ
jgi:hypothetical protein